MIDTRRLRSTTVSLALIVLSAIFYSIDKNLFISKDTYQ